MPMSPRCSSTMRMAVVRLTSTATIRKMTGSTAAMVSMEAASLSMLA